MHRRNIPVVLIVALSLLGAGRADAQVCLGRPSLNVAAVNAGLRLDRRDGATGFGAGVSAGADRAFAGLAVSNLRYRELDASASSVSAYAGWSVPPSIATLFICPLIQVGYGRGPNEDSTTYTVQRSSQSALAGLAVAGQIALSNTVSIIPNVTAGVLLQRSTRTGNGASESGGDLGATISGGLSVLLTDRLAIQSAVRLPVGFGDKDPVYSLGVIAGFRKRTP